MRDGVVVREILIGLGVLLAVCNTGDLNVQAYVPCQENASHALSPPLLCKGGSRSNSTPARRSVSTAPRKAMRVAVTLSLVAGSHGALPHGPLALALSWEKSLHATSCVGSSRTAVAGLQKAANTSSTMVLSACLLRCCRGHPFVVNQSLETLRRNRPLAVLVHSRFSERSRVERSLLDLVCRLLRRLLPQIAFLLLFCEMRS